MAGEESGTDNEIARSCALCCQSASFSASITKWNSSASCTVTSTETVQCTQTSDAVLVITPSGMAGLISNSVTMPSCAENSALAVREIVVYSVFSLCIGLCVVLGLIALLSCLYVKKKSKKFTPHGKLCVAFCIPTKTIIIIMLDPGQDSEISNLYGSRLGRQLSLIQNTLTDGEEGKLTSMHDA